jgi:CRP-like cAMP-binding protein
LVCRVRAVTLEPGQVLFRQGDPANSLYVVVEGAVVPIAEDDRRRKLAVLERGAFFGEIGLMTKQPRNSTIEALVETKLLAIDRRLLRQLIDDAPSVAKSILRFLRARLIDRQIRTNRFFSAFAHGERDAVAKQFRFLEVEDGAKLIERGRAPEGLYVVLSGELGIVGPASPDEQDLDKELAGLGLGDVFGGLSLIDGRLPPGDVVARGKCWLVVLHEGRFRRILEANPRLDRILRRIAQEVAESSASGQEGAVLL